MNEKQITIHFKWPWTMIPLECADDWIDYISKNIDKNHPFFGKKIFPSARREDENMILIENDDDDTFGIISFDFTNDRTKKYGKILRTEIITSRKELADRIDRDHRLALNNDENG